MPSVTFTSEKFPGISLILPEVPGAKPPAPGSYYFSVGNAYEVSAACVPAIEEQLAGAPENVRNYIKVSVDSGVSVASTVAIAAPPPPPPAAPPVVDSPGEETDEPPVVEDVELSDDDLDLVQVEIGKIVGKRIAEAEPVLIATGGNPELPKSLRQFYLQEVIKHPEIQKGLKETAQALLEQI